jgi:hypothetical protein
MSVYTEIDSAACSQPIDELMCAALRGEDVCWPGGNGARFAETLLERSDYHGVQALLHECLRSKEGCPASIQKGLHGRAIGLAGWELRHQHLLTEMVARLAKKGIEPVFFKGTALAYSHYDNAVLRPRGDSDVIVRSQDRAQVHEALASLGFKRSMGVSGEFISYQAGYSRDCPGSGQHDIDVHWRITNSQLLSKLFSYEELRSKAVSLPHLCTDAVAAGPVHALLIACMHRAVHKQTPYYVDSVTHYSGDRRIWLYDIHLLAGTLTCAQWQEVLSLARHKGLSSVCLEGLERAQTCFQTSIPEFVSTGLAHSGGRETVSIYLDASNLRQLWMNFSAMDSVSNRVGFIRELVFPPIAYMRTKYPDARPSRLPWLYARRALGGLIKRLSVSQ